MSKKLNAEKINALPESTIGERIKKCRLKLGLSREVFAKSIKSELKTVVLWEQDKIIPKAPSIKKISDTYNIPLEYFHNYYYIYYNNPIEKFLKWKKENNYTYEQLGKMIKADTSTIHNFASGKYKLSFSLYKQLKELEVF
ncbi:multiprotein-bridging factor 1 family protein [Clostridium paraputrificum]|uniref:multiprotein-bridging factor 1 family protein n=1 Tax=Clostridium paraputrificum TaxID=29363 RepID=UPI0034A4A769